MCWTNRSLQSCTDLLFSTQQTFRTQNLAAHVFQLIMVFKPSLVQSSVSSAPGISIRRIEAGRTVLSYEVLADRLMTPETARGPSDAAAVKIHRKTRSVAGGGPCEENRETTWQLQQRNPRLVPVPSKNETLNLQCFFVMSVLVCEFYHWLVNGFYSYTYAPIRTKIYRNFEPTVKGFPYKSVIWAS